MAICFGFYFKIDSNSFASFDTFAGQTAPRQPAVNPDEQMIVHKEEILDPEDNDENQQVVLAGI